MIHLRFFASFREIIKTDEEYYPFEGFSTVVDLKKLLSHRGTEWKAVFQGETVVKAAVNKEIVSDDFLLHDKDEVAFFPPMTGG